MYYTRFCVHYFKSYGEIDNILDTWRPLWILSILIDLKSYKKMQSLFFLITTMFQKVINQKITFNKDFVRKYIRAYTSTLHGPTPPLPPPLL